MEQFSVGTTWDDRGWFRPTAPSVPLRRHSYLPTYYTALKAEHVFHCRRRFPLSDQVESEGAWLLYNGTPVLILDETLVRMKKLYVAAFRIDIFRIDLNERPEALKTVHNQNFINSCTISRYPDDLCALLHGGTNS